ncbi:hypothetical protein F4780DRAFT_764637 [Xylariomycetidae sp. FL0641]|nr:hypothetical protein F4780DRAFT_764637 [Xylariomycetidae sp. FL0641]
MGRFTITEPHPTVHKNTYTHAGRGGAGNYFRAPTTTPASGVPTVAEGLSLPPKASRFHSGRGGAGNAHAAAERPVLSFDEEYARHANIEQKPLGHTGRGGAGNVFTPGTASVVPGSSGSRKTSDASSHHSGSSTGSRVSGFLSRLTSRN